MKDSEIYLKAAKRISLAGLVSQRWSFGCCDAIANAVPEHSTGHIQRDFSELFQPDGFGAYWWDSSGSNEDQQARILALLFARAIAKSEGR